MHRCSEISVIIKYRLEELLKAWLILLLSIFIGERMINRVTLIPHKRVLRLHDCPFKASVGRFVYTGVLKWREFTIPVSSTTLNKNILASIIAKKGVTRKIFNIRRKKQCKFY